MTARLEPTCSPFAKRPRGSHPPLSHAQRRVWFLEQLHPGSALHNLSCAFRLRGSLQHAALTSVLQAVAQRHESLRTTIGCADGEPYLRIAQHCALDLPLVDLRHVGDPEEIALLEDSELSGLAEQPFDLENGPLVRAALIRRADDEHTLFFLAHQIVWDARSFDVWLAELDGLYASYREGCAPRLAQHVVQYADFALWQREWLESGERERQLEYWREQLAGASASLDLPTDRPRPAVMSHRGATLQTSIDAGLAEELRALARREDAELYAVLLAGLYTLLHRYTGQEDVSIGFPIEGARQGALGRSIGLFANTLVLRGDLSGRPSFRTLLRRVQEICARAQGQADLPFEQLVDALRPERDRSRSAFYQVLFDYQDTRLRPQRIADLPLELLPRTSASVPTDLCFRIEEGPRALALALDYNTDLFDRATAERMLQHLQVLLQGVVARPEAELLELPLLTSQERELVLHTWNRTEVEWSGGSCVHGLIAAQAALTPDAVAVRCADQALTYRELEEAAHRLAHALRALGVGPDTRVAICVERSVELAVGLLGILQAGAAYVPLDPSYPTERLVHMVRDSGAAAIVVRPAFEAMFAGTGVKLIVLDPANADLAAQPTTDPAVPVAAQHLAYVIYTSGSTGVPKGVMVEHRQVVNMLLALREPLSLRAGDRFVSSSRLSFDMSVLEVFGSLAFGLQLTLSPVAGRMAPLGQLLEESAATHFQSTPSQIAIWISDPRARRAMGQLRALCVGGEELPPALASELTALLPGRVFQLYGPTETTVWSCAQRLLPGEPSLRIGRPIANTRVYVLDEAGGPAPIGVVGELYIGGAGVARGYRDRPELDAERFLPDPFAPGGGRMYRTGDHGRLRADGTLEFHGRRDTQIKLRGHRIELGEIESRLAAHPQVREAAAALREWSPGDRRIVAYVVPRGAPAPGADALREHLRLGLPDFMLPAAYVVLDALPHNSNGKLDRKALPAPPTTAAEAAAYVPPADGLEQRMAEIWAGVLGLSRVGALDDFFDLGGHSLLAVRLVDVVQRELDVPLSLAAFFEAPTLRTFTAHVREARQGTAAASARWTTIVPVQPGGGRPPFFCAAGTGGNPMNLRHLARHLGGEQPFFGLQVRGVDGQHRPHETIEAMAAEHVRDIRQQQPEGPYYLGGYSGGGLVSLEIARQLRELGCEVALLVFLDAYHPKLEEWSSSERVQRHVQRLREVGPRYLAESARRRALYALGSVRLRIAAALARLFPFRFRLEAVRIAFERSLERYRIRPYAGAVLLFRAEAPLQGPGIGLRLDPYHGWGDAVEGEIDVVTVPGNHNSLVMEPHAGVLAERLREALDRARARVGSEPR